MNNEQLKIESYAIQEKIGFGDITEIMTLITDIEKAAQTDIVGNGQADLLTVYQLAKQAVADLEAFKVKLPSLNVSTFVPALTASLVQLKTITTQIQTIIGADVTAWRSQFPAIFKSL